MNKKKLVQLSVTKEKDVSSPFLNGLERSNHTPYSLDVNKVSCENNPEYGKEAIFNIPLNSDLLHRSFIEITIPNIELNIDILNKIDKNKYEDYLTFKNNKLNSFQNNIVYWDNKYLIFFEYSNIQSEIFVEVNSILNINNFSIDFIKSRILGIINKYLNYNEILLQIEANILNETNIEDFITNFNNINNLTISEIKEVILNSTNKKYKNITNYLKYYYRNKVYYQKKYDEISNNKIYYRWIENLNHFYITSYDFYINGITIDNYSNDYLNIYMSHTITEDFQILYDKISRNDNTLYDITDYNKKLYAPLLFSFSDFLDSSKALPLIALQNSNLSIRCNINKLSNLIYFNNWEELYNKNLIIDIPRKDHNKNETNNVEIFNFENIEYESVELILPENIYRYKFKNINKIILQKNFEGIDFENILNTYGIDDDNGNKVLNLNEWIFMMNNIKTEPNISEASKIILLDYHYFIDYNYLLNLIPKPNIKLLLENGYIDDVEKRVFMNKRLEYIYKTKQEVIFEINNNSLFDSLNDISGLIKEVYFIIQPNLIKEGLTLYSKSNLNSYDNFTLINDNDNNNNIYENLELSISNEYNLFSFNDKNFNNVISYNYFYSELPKGVIYKSFGLYHIINQPSGSVNLSTASGQNFLIEFNDDVFNNYLNNKNNPNNLGFSVKLIYVKYNMLHIENGIGELIFYN